MVETINNNENENSSIALPKMHEALDRLMIDLKDDAKEATLLLCTEGEDDGSPISTKIGGHDFYFPSNKKWPENVETGNLLTPIIQINLEDFAEYSPKEKKGLLQIFLDFEQDIDDIVITKETKGVEIRYIADVSEDKARKIEVSDDLYFEGPFTINKKKYLSLPSAKSKYSLPEEHLFMKYKWDKVVSKEGERLWSVYNYTDNIYIEDQIISRIGGYAPWIDKDQTPICAKCGNRMSFFGAVGTEDTEFDFGGDGYVMIFHCSYMAKCGSLSNPSLIIQMY